MRGLEAIVAGFPPTPAQSVVKLSLAQRNFSTLASILGRHGYESEFIYGGEAHFDNMRGFFTGNGFNRVTDQNDYSAPVFKGSWGVSDEDLFTRTHERLRDKHREGKPSIFSTHPISVRGGVGVHVSRAQHVCVCVPQNQPVALSSMNLKMALSQMPE